MNEIVPFYKRGENGRAASTSSENLATPTSTSGGRLSRIPSMPRSQNNIINNNRNKSGIPVAAQNRDPPQPPYRGLDITILLLLITNLHN